MPAQLANSQSKQIAYRQVKNIFFKWRLLKMILIIFTKKYNNHITFTGIGDASIYEKSFIKNSWRWELQKNL